MSKKDEFGNTPLIYAAGSGNVELVKELIKEFPNDINYRNINSVPIRDSNGKHLGHLKHEKNMYGDNPENRGDGSTFGEFPLYVALEAGHFEVCKVLINAGADVNLRLKAFNLTIKDLKNYDKLESYLNNAL